MNDQLLQTCNLVAMVNLLGSKTDAVLTADLRDQVKFAELLTDVKNFANNCAMIAEHMLSDIKKNQGNG